MSLTERIVWKSLTTTNSILETCQVFENCLANVCHYHADIVFGDAELLVCFYDGEPILYAGKLNQSIIDVGSKTSSPPSRKYFAAVLSLLNSDQITEVWDVDNQLGAAGIVEINGVWESIMDVPNGTVVNHSLNLNNGYNVTKLPDNLMINGDLYIGKTSIETLPKGLMVNGTLDVRYSPCASSVDNSDVQCYEVVQ